MLDPFTTILIMAGYTADMERQILFNDILNTLYLWICGVGPFR